MRFAENDISRLCSKKLINTRNFSVQCKLQDDNNSSTSLRVPSTIDRNSSDKVITPSFQSFSNTFGSNCSISDITSCMNHAESNKIAKNPDQDFHHNSGKKSQNEANFPKAKKLKKQKENKENFQ